MLHVAVLTGDIAGRRNVVPALGLTYLITSLFMVPGPPVAGKSAFCVLGLSLESEVEAGRGRGIGFYEYFGSS